MNQKILVFAGKKQSGKSSATNFVVGYILAQMGRRGNVNCPNNFTIDEDGTLIVDTILNDIDGNTVIEGGVLDLNRKDADFLIWAENVMYPYVRPYAFADNLKRIAVEIFNINPQFIYGSNDDKNQPTHIKWKDMCQFIPPRKVNEVKKSEKFDKNMTGREFLQYFGTNVCRTLDDDCWTRSCFNEILIDSSELSIIQDCRFANEVKASYKIKEQHDIDVKVVKLTREIGFDVHESENGLKGISDNGYDLVIDNEYMNIKEKNQAILDALYDWGWLSGHIGLEVK